MFRSDVVRTEVDQRPQLAPYERSHPLDLSPQDPFALLARGPARIRVWPYGARRRRAAIERRAVDDAVIAVPQRLVYGKLLKPHAVLSQGEHHRGLQALGMARVELGWLGRHP